MITRFDIGEKVYIEAQVDRIHISDKGSISYDIRIPGTMTKLVAAEDELNKIPTTDLEWVKEAKR